MAEGILTNLLLQSADLMVRSTRIGPIAAATSTLICNNEPQRLLILVVPDDVRTFAWVRPNNQLMASVSKVNYTPGSFLIHASEYPGLIRLPWYVVLDTLDSITVYEVLRIG